MKKLTALVAGLLISTAVYASCRTNTIIVNGKMMTCTTCCYGGNCTTNCF